MLKKNEYKIYVINELSKPTFDTLYFGKEGRIVGLEILVTGHLNGKSVLQFENEVGRFHKLDLEGHVNQVYDTEWYSSKLFFKYLPDTNVQGDSLILRYKMY